MGNSKLEPNNLASNPAGNVTVPTNAVGNPNAVPETKSSLESQSLGLLPKKTISPDDDSWLMPGLDRRLVDPKFRATQVVVNPAARKAYFEQRPGLLKILTRLPMNPLFIETPTAKEPHMRGELFLPPDGLAKLVASQIKKLQDRYLMEYKKKLRSIDKNAEVPQSVIEEIQFLLGRIWVIDNNRCALIEKLQENKTFIEQRDQANLTIIYTDKEHTIAVYVCNLQGQKYCYIADSLGVTYVAKALILEITRELPGVKIFAGPDLQGQRNYGCAVYSYQASQIFMKHGYDFARAMKDNLAKEVTEMLDDGVEVTYTALSLEHTHPRFLKLSQTVYEEEKLPLSASSLAVVSQRKNIPLKHYLELYELRFPKKEKPFNVACLAKKYRLFNKLDELLHDDLFVAEAPEIYCPPHISYLIVNRYFGELQVHLTKNANSLTEKSCTKLITAQPGQALQPVHVTPLVYAIHLLKMDMDPLIKKATDIIKSVEKEKVELAQKADEGLIKKLKTLESFKFFCPWEVEELKAERELMGKWKKSVKDHLSVNIKECNEEIEARQKDLDQGCASYLKVRINIVAEIAKSLHEKHTTLDSDDREWLTQYVADDRLKIILMGNPLISAYLSECVFVDEPECSLHFSS